MLEPQRRSSLYDILRPATGMELDCLVATTYSASLDTVLSLPGAMLVEGHNAQAREAGLFTPADLAALKRICSRTMVFCQGAAIHPAQSISPAIIEAEEMVHEVTAPNGGSFHPKVWIARFQASGSPAQVLRVAVMSRNLTADRSWDAGLVFESGVWLDKQDRNDLGDLLRLLPERCLRPMAANRVALLAELTSQVERVKWRMPADVGRPTFHLVGGRAQSGWTQPPSDRLAILSPFLTTSAIKTLTTRTKAPAYIVSRPTALEDCWHTLDDCFERKFVLAAPDDDGPGGRAPALHAKIIAWEWRKRVHLAIGSMNATTAAITGANVEFMVSLDCTKIAGRGVDALLENTGLGSVIEDFAPEPGSPPAPASFNDREARSCLLTADLHLQCSQAADGWEITLVPASPNAEIARLLPKLRFHPVTLAAHRATSCAQALGAGIPARLAGVMELSQITGFTHFEADRPAGQEGSTGFVLNLEVRGVDDEERRQAALKAIIPDDRSFNDFLRTLLGDFQTLASGSAGGGHGSLGSGWAPGSQTGLLELLIRCASDEPERLASIRQTLKAFSPVEFESVTSLEFRQLWKALLESTDPV